MPASVVKVGTCVRIERRTFTGALDHVYEKTVVRITVTRAYLDAVTWFRLDDPMMVVTPRYLDYISRAFVLSGSRE